MPISPFPGTAAEVIGGTVISEGRALLKSSEFISLYFCIFSFTNFSVDVSATHFL
jgi:hypothetical protein